MKMLKATQNFLLVLIAACVVTNVAFAKNSGDKIKDAIDYAADALKKGVDELGDDLSAIQNYLDHYQWKGIIQGDANSGVLTLSDLRLNDRHRVIVVRPGALIQGEVVCYVDPNKASSFDIYRAVIGLKGVGPQTTFSTLGIASGKKLEKFTMQAPMLPGFYEIRYKTVNKLLEARALESWKDDQGKEPGASSTIGIIVVKS